MKILDFSRIVIYSANYDIIICNLLIFVLAALQIMILVYVNLISKRFSKFAELEKTSFSPFIVYLTGDHSSLFLQDK